MRLGETEESFKYHPPMTILGALLTDTAVYMASDAAERTPDYWSGHGVADHLDKPKVQQVGSQALLWAYYGDGVRGDALAKWVQTNAIGFKNWTIAVDKIKAECADVNARPEWVGHPTVGAVFAGWLDGTQDYCHIPIGSGCPNLYSVNLNKNPHFAGIGCCAGDVAFAASEKALPDAESLFHFENAMESTIRNIADLWGGNSNFRDPLKLIRVTRNAKVTTIRGRPQPEVTTQ